MAPFPTCYRLFSVSSNTLSCASNETAQLTQYGSVEQVATKAPRNVQYAGLFGDSDDESSSQTNNAPPSLNGSSTVQHPTDQTAPQAISTPMVGELYIVSEAAVDGRNFTDITCSFCALVGSTVLAAFQRRENGVPKNRIDTFRSYVVYQCALDHRSLGDSLLYATSIDSPFSVDGFKTTANGFHVVGAVSSATKTACMQCFLDTDLISGGINEDIEYDMDLFSNYPFYMLACTSLDGSTVHSACVFRVHTLNNGHRLVALELLASDPNDTVTVGAGTALMQVLREFSMLSPVHPGHISASTETTKQARGFYKRQLPECDSPQARAFLVSVAFLDINVELKKHLEMRCTTVWPGTTGRV
jgi:hypothetical protein